MDSRPPPPQGAPPSYAFVNRVYRRNLRPVVIATTFLGAFWALFAAIGSFRSVAIDRAQNVPKLSTISIALGALYITVSVIEAFGIFSAVRQRLALIRIYAFLSAFAALIVVASGLTRTVMHFTLKGDIIKECTNLSDGATIFFGYWGPVSHETLNSAEAAEWCNNAWHHNSSSEIVSLLITMFLAGLFTVIAFSYYRQVLDPSSPANASRAPSYQVRMDGYPPAHYNPPYNASVPNLGYNAGPYTGQPYAPPPGPPPPRDDAFAPPYDGKPPGYGAGEGRSLEGDLNARSVEKDDPFADFDGPSAGGERDAPSRAAAAGRDAFR